MTTERKKLSEWNYPWSVFLVFTLFLLADPKCFTNAQYYRGITPNDLQNFYKRLTTPKPNVEEKLHGNLASFLSRTKQHTELVNNSIKAYIRSSSTSRREFPLAVPLGIRVGEAVRKDHLHQTNNKTEKRNNKTEKKNNTQKAIDLEKVQKWRFKLIQGTNKHLKDIFIGKCWDYQTRLKVLKKPVDCTRLWEAFLAGFAYKEPCDVTLEDYDVFFTMIHEDPLVNKSMLWSGSREVTHELSSFNMRFTALEDTFAGYLVDGMQWCGMPVDPGINYRQCPYECAKQKAFWGAAAKKMAERSEGIVYAVINGTRKHWDNKQVFSAYMKDSYMARNQVANLNPHKVKEVRIMVGHSLHRKVLERCGTFSIKELQRQIESRGIKTSCVDDPLSLRALLCLDYPKDALCQFHLTALLSER